MKLRWRRLTTFAVVLAIVNLGLWFASPWLRVASLELLERTSFANQPDPSPPATPVVQELFVYFDPWLVWLIIPLIYTVGLVAMAMLLPPAEHPDKPTGSILVTSVLVVLTCVWLTLVVLGALFRGPWWNFSPPWRPAWALQFEVQPSLSYSQLFHYAWLGERWHSGQSLLVEAPALVLAAGYFLWGALIARKLSRGQGAIFVYWGGIFLVVFLLTPLVLRECGVAGLGSFSSTVKVMLPVVGTVLLAGYVVMRYLRRLLQDRTLAVPIPYWRCFMLVLLVQLALLVPMKMALYWAFDVKYFLKLPWFAF